MFVEMFCKFTGKLVKNLTLSSIHRLIIKLMTDDAAQ